MSSTVVADSSGIISLVSTTDVNHSLGLSISHRIRRDAHQLVLPGEVFTEVVNVLGKKVGHPDAIAVGAELLRSSEYLLADTDDQIRRRAFEKFTQSSGAVSFTDCIVMAVADQFETKDVFGFDEVFSKDGYTRFGYHQTILPI
jgi:predicted nucleic acid-binding protein